MKKNEHGRCGSPSILTPSWAARLRARDAQAWVLLDYFYRAAMIRRCRGYLGNLEQSEDAVQDIFIKVLRVERVPSRFRPWLCRVARNHCLRILRDQARQGNHQIPPPAPQAMAKPAGALAQLVKRENGSRIMRLLGTLPAKQREALLLRYAEGLSRAEIADLLQIPESTVKSELYRGLKKLRQCLPLSCDT